MLDGLTMFILPLSVFLTATYLRPRTQAELSYIITAIECLSGLWCLLFAPFMIQISLISLFLLRNTKDISSLLSGLTGQSHRHVDLSQSETTTIDIVAHPVLPPHLVSSVMPAGMGEVPVVEYSPISSRTVPANIDSPTAIVAAPCVALAPMTLTHAKPHHNHAAIAKISNASPLAPSPQIPSPPQLIQMQYRGVTYFKRVSFKRS